MRADRPFISLNEVKMELPCLEDHWEAASPQAWAALHPWTWLPPQMRTFTSVLADILDSPDVALGSLKDSYHRLVIVATLIRLVFTNKEAVTQSGAKSMACYDALVVSRERLLDITDRFACSPTQSQTRTTTSCHEALVRQLRLVHIAHGFSTDDLVEYWHLVWRGGPRSLPAKAYISKWIRENGKRFRRLIYGSAQLLTLTRVYPYNDPAEVYDCFAAGMTMWAMVSLFIAMQPPQQTTEPRRLCNLDWLGPRDDPESLAVREWIETGGPYIVRMHGVADMLSSAGCQQILQQTAQILARRSVWGITQNFLNATLRVLHSQE